MPKRQVFFSFHFDSDVMRVQQIRNMGAIDGETLLSPNAWEEVKAKGIPAIKKWIDDNMNYRSCVIVLIGEHTANSDWVKYEIKKAVETGKGLFGIYIHNLKVPRIGTCSQGTNPFNGIYSKDGQNLANIIPCYNPDINNAYGFIMNNIENWIEKAIAESPSSFLLK